MPHPLERELLRALDAVPGLTGVVLAYSGGCDSTALVAAGAAVQGRLGVPVRAVHVDHGLHAHSPRWAAHCRRVAGGLGIPVEVVRLTAVDGAGVGLEAAAREARYRVLAERLAPGEAAIVAHHREDQAETVLLALLRGSGPRGLAAMPASRRLGRGWLLRPWLGRSRDELAGYCRQRGLAWIDDPDNECLSRDRNFVRHRVLPLLAGRWPRVSSRLAEVAALQARALAGQEALAERDLGALGGAGACDLPLAPLCALPEHRRHEALRLWVRRRGLPPIPRRALAAFERELVPARDDATPVVRWRGGELRRHRGRVYAMPPLPPPPPRWARRWTPGAGELALPAGRLRAECRDDGALRLDAGVATVEVRLRGGGERLRLRPGGPSVRLKELMRTLGMPPWERATAPVLWVGAVPVLVPGVGVDARFAAPPGAPGWHIEWLR